MLTTKGLRHLNRYQASFGHFCLSLLVLIILGYLVYFCWYPQPLFAIDAGWQGLRILAAVDFILGPLITLFIFNPKKKELIKDLAIIALIQISALSYGVYHVYQSRPAIVVYADNQFRTVALSQLEFYELPQKILNNIPMFEPSYYILDIPRDNIIALDKHTINLDNMEDILELYDAQRKALMEANIKGIPYYLIPSRLLPYQDNLKIIETASIPAKDIINSGEDNSEINSFIDTNNGLSITAIKGRFGNALVSINAQGKFVDYLKSDFSKSWLSK